MDPARIGLWGGSYGGYLTALGLARNSDLFAAGVDIHGIHDWTLEITNTIPQSEPEKRQQVFRTAYDSSPLSSVAKWRSPVLLIQGDDDRDVAFANSPRLTEALRRQGVPFQQVVFPDEIHDFLIQAHWLTAYHCGRRLSGEIPEALMPRRPPKSAPFPPLRWNETPLPSLSYFA